MRLMRGLTWAIASLSLCIFAGFLHRPVPVNASPPSDDGRAHQQTFDGLTYQFVARISNNGGIIPFKVGEKIQGQFTYDPNGRDKFPNAREYGSFVSPLNRFSFQLGDLRFNGTGEIRALVSQFKSNEHFGLVAPDLKLPRGWEMDHTRRSQSYGIVFQNVPPRGFIVNKRLPNRLALSDFVSTREIVLDFFHGVRFPGGKVQGRATVIATVESLKRSNVGQTR